MTIGVRTPLAKMQIRAVTAQIPTTSKRVAAYGRPCFISNQTPPNSGTDSSGTIARIVCSGEMKRTRTTNASEPSTTTMLRYLSTSAETSWMIGCAGSTPGALANRNIGFMGLTRGLHQGPDRERGSRQARGTGIASQ